MGHEHKYKIQIYTLYKINTGENICTTIINRKKKSMLHCLKDFCSVKDPVREWKPKTWAGRKRLDPRPHHSVRTWAEELKRRFGKTGSKQDNRQMLNIFITMVLQMKSAPSPQHSPAQRLKPEAPQTLNAGKGVPYRSVQAQLVGRGHRTATVRQLEGAESAML